MDQDTGQGWFLKHCWWPAFSQVALWRGKRSDKNLQTGHMCLNSSISIWDSGWQWRFIDQPSPFGFRSSLVFFWRIGFEERLTYRCLVDNTNLPALFVAQNQPYPHLRVNKEPKTVASLDGEKKFIGSYNCLFCFATKHVPGDRNQDIIFFVYIALSSKNPLNCTTCMTDVPEVP